MLVPAALDRAAERKLNERARRTGKKQKFTNCATQILDEFATAQKSYLLGQRSAKLRIFDKTASPGRDEASTTQKAYEEFELAWSDPEQRLRMLPGKEAFSAINKSLQDRYNISLTASAVIDAMNTSEIPLEMKSLLDDLERFGKLLPLDS
ncbi:MAG TPA: hypothetical protein VFQ69_12415 [Rhizomicrobium sp.]|nr:hypothetical protein [Rhizomicrobium sp.]